MFHFPLTGLELVTPRLRTISGTILNCFYALGGIYLGLVAMWFRDFKSLLLITYIPSFVVLAYTCLLPQSKCIPFRPTYTKSGNTQSEQKKIGINFHFAKKAYDGSCQREDMKMRRGCCGKLAS
jgi:hypothetical protein